MAGQRLDRRHERLIALGALGLLACGTPPPPPPGAIPLDQLVDARNLAGTWEWLHTEPQGNALVREREHWQLAIGEDARHLVGTVRRDVLVRAFDSVPFVCNQRTRYRQRATLTVTAEVTAAGISLTERSYDAEPSPCDPGLRQLGSYLGELDGDTLTLRWDGGVATLHRTKPVPPRPVPIVAAPPGGRWLWQATSWTKAGMLREEDEDWELAAADDGTLAGTYVRVVTVRSPDDKPLPCAGASRYSFVDRYLVRGRRDEDGWRLDEVAVQPGHHPCLADTPARNLDAAVASIDGDYLVLEWRGKRRQVLGRALLE